MQFRTSRLAMPGDDSALSPVLTEDYRISAEEARVLGCLMEKEATTPDYYPLSLNSLVAACNQKSSRDPVVNYTEGDVVEALEALQARGLTRRITSSDGGRVARYRHVADGALKLTQQQAAVICVLLLRGPQTIGEIRQRTGRIHDFDSLAEVEETLQDLSEKTPRALVVKLARRPGTKDSRFAQLLTEDPDEETAADDAVEHAVPMAASKSDRVQELEAEVAELKERLETLETAFERFRDQFQ